MSVVATIPYDLPTTLTYDERAVIRDALFSALGTNDVLFRKERSEECAVRLRSMRGWDETLSTDSETRAEQVVRLAEYCVFLNEAETTWADVGAKAKTKHLLEVLTREIDAEKARKRAECLRETRHARRHAAAARDAAHANPLSGLLRTKRFRPKLTYEDVKDLTGYDQAMDADYDG